MAGPCADVARRCGKTRPQENPQHSLESVGQPSRKEVESAKIVTFGSKLDYPCLTVTGGRL